MEDDDDNEDELSCKLCITSWLFAYGEGNIKITDMMKVAGYEMPERKSGTIYQHVRLAGEAL